MLDIERVREQQRPLPISKIRAQQSHTSFQGVFEEIAGHKSEKTVYAILETLEKDGERLAKHRTAAELHAFKRSVRQCVSHLLESLKVETASSAASGQVRQYKLVKEIDKGLVELTNAVFDQSKSELDLLNKIGELQGLIIQLYL
ncbi:YaaR family protein [Shouchella clausii]|jgi:uncharacterized protein|uniref:DUF327 domain-containing protein n=3 Tax=Shouchella TaxID=2893057 RepID=Q5WH66_SHOC1|nr:MULTISPECIES: YaaR family protein [Shouchella]ALA51073.1 hypothetical protein DB29_00245 [Shouchella clausii]MBU3231869.1 YaaR family protein [Shouchella clausii]MBU3264847.1 YaaR family protein [Shouchella clausii]MBU3507690.1 YaaR family protein [Shouchella clausii]MBU3533333.1 YaaR family protein [Shouchella clausii]